MFSVKVSYYYFLSPYSLFIFFPLHLSFDHPYINLYRRSKIIVCVGQGSWEEDCISDTRKIQGQFDRLQIPCWIDYWGYDVPHDWPSWLLQTPYFFSHILN